MHYPHGLLTDQQVKETFFIVPDLGFAFAYSPSCLGKIQKAKKAIRANGGELIVIGWPDGSTIVLVQTVAGNGINVDRLLLHYRENAKIQFAMKNSGGDHES